MAWTPRSRAAAFSRGRLPNVRSPTRKVSPTTASDHSRAGCGITRGIFPPGAWEDKHRAKFQAWCPPCEASAGNSRHLRAYLENNVYQSHNQNTRCPDTIINYM